MGGESPSSSFLPLWFNPIRSVRQSTLRSYASTAIVESLRATLTYSQQHKTTTACPYRNLVLSLRLRAFYKALCVSSHLTFVPPTIGCEGFMISARHAMVTSSHLLTLSLFRGSALRPSFGCCTCSRHPKRRCL